MLRAQQDILRLWLRLGFLCYMHGSDASRVVLPSDVLEPGLFHKVRQALLIGECLDGTGEVHESLAVARDEATPEGYKVLQIEAVKGTP